MRNILILFLFLLGSRSAHAGAWTRDSKHFYLSLGWARIAANAQFARDFRVVPSLARYEQHVVYFYGELGIIDRLLTLSVDAQTFRFAEYQNLGSTSGLGDFRVGLWTGMLDKPVRFSFGLLLGIPSGNPDPSRNQPGLSAEERSVQRLLPTGDGEVDVEARAALGYSFGGKRYWPLQHYVVGELGYWMRTRGYGDALTWKAELGIRFPWRFIERFWLILRLSGIESLALGSTAIENDITGLKSGVTYTAYGAQLWGRIYKGLGAAVGVDSAFRARAVPAAVQINAALSYQY
jgi:hypothetical protein